MNALSSNGRARLRKNYPSNRGHGTSFSVVVSCQVVQVHLDTDRLKVSASWILSAPCFCISVKAKRVMSDSQMLSKVMLIKAFFENTLFWHGHCV